MPLGYEVFDGNRTDVTTVEKIVGTMEVRYGQANRIWVTDRGMTSAENIAWLQPLPGRPEDSGTTPGGVKSSRTTWSGKPLPWVGCKRRSEKLRNHFRRTTSGGWKNSGTTSSGKLWNHFRGERLPWSRKTLDPLPWVGVQEDSGSTSVGRGTLRLVIATRHFPASTSARIRFVDFGVEATRMAAACIVTSWAATTGRAATTAVLEARHCA